MGITKDPIVRTPNFSIVIPSGCNAKCDFCFWIKKQPSDNYIEKLEEILLKMPQPYFNQISLTGGEPTLSPIFSDVLNLLKQDNIKKYYNKVVLTSNGYRIKEYIKEMQGVVKHVNISRHSSSDIINRLVFDTDTVPNINELKTICKEFDIIGIDVTLSAVIDDVYINTKEDIIEYINFAKETGANAVSFRIKHGSIVEHQLEKEFSNIEFTEHDCGVCRHRKQIINNLLVTWKSSVSEPSNDLNGVIYEAVYNQDGILTKDWNGEHEILFKSEPNI